MEFTKQALTTKQQLSLLSKQGLIINNKEKAEHVLSVIGYYRLSSYTLPFKSSHHNNAPRKFISGTTFDAIWKLYQFDRELRMLISAAIEKIEVAFRASIANNLATRFGPFCYTERSIYKSTRPYEVLIRNIDRIVKEQHEVFVKHYLQKYNNPMYPPIWMIIETLSFGNCSKLFSNLKHVGNKKQICSIFNYAPTIIDSWIETLVYVRNICAHHARLWNRWLVNAPIIPKEEVIPLILENKNRQFISVAYLILKLLDQISPKSCWKQRLCALFEKYQDFPGESMGFRNEWQNDLFWELP